MDKMTILFLFIASICLHTSYPSIVKQTGKDAPILFPESIEVVDDIPESCKNLTYCIVKPKNYPQERFDEMFKNYIAFPLPVMENEIENRQGDPNEIDDCDKEVTFAPLYNVQDPHSKVWRHVVQSAKHQYIQQVRLETCRNEGQKCFTEFTSTRGYETFCKQKYNKWHVLVAKENNETETIKVDLPVCCSCHYRKMAFITRIGQH